MNSNQLSFQIVPYASPEYIEAVALREDVLRRPIGLSFSQVELEAEKEHIHITGLLGNRITATAVLRARWQPDETCSVSQCGQSCREEELAVR